ncbi:MFS transporter [Agreia sp. COWG]|uniref:MFS transporter n=1 Tax=Agreia sp. COWG TaxID=2773266 RepID=UPI001927C0F1|nr:MFS transporter [Agreia sp. COWG]
MSISPQVAGARPLDSGFVRYLSARLISIGGAAATTIVVPILVFQTTGSAALTGITGGIGGISYFVFGIPIGHLVDRWPRGRVLIGCSAARSLVLLAVPVLTFVSLFRIQYLIVVLVLTNVLFVATDAANAGALRAVAGAKGMQKANAIVAGTAAIVQMGAPLAAGAALAITNPQSIFLVESIALLLSAGVLWTIRHRLDSPRTGAALPSRTWAAALSGFAFIWRDMPVRTTTAASLVFAVLEGIVIGQLVILLAYTYGHAQSSSLLGWTYTGIAAGSLIGSWLLVRLPFPRHPAFLSSLALFVSAVLLVSAVSTVSPLIFISLIGLWAVPYMVVFVGATALRQTRADPDLQGRVAVAGRLLTMGTGVPIGSVLGGLVSEASGVHATYVTAACIAVAASAALAFAARSARSQRHP